MKRFFAAALLVMAAVTARAGEPSPVVVELFTSQGCSSCPPADRMLHELAGREDVIALALHVDYWDYIGWKDEFASAAHSQRQREYAAVAGRRSVYTPQMIVNGETSVVGAKAMKLADAIRDHRDDDSGVSLTLARAGDDVTIAAQADRAVGPMEVSVLRYDPLRKISITRGENAGHDFAYANVVRDWQVAAAWSGAEPLTLDVPAPGDAPVVVLIQAAGRGPILAAARLR